MAMIKEVFDSCPLKRTIDYFYYDTNTGEVTIESIQDCSQIIKSTQADQANHDNKFKDDIRKHSWAKAASIPNTIIEEWLKEGIHVIGKQARSRENLKKIQAKLNGDYSRLKTTTHRIALA